ALPRAAPRAALLGLAGPMGRDAGAEEGRRLLISPVRVARRQENLGPSDCAAYICSATAAAVRGAVAAPASAFADRAAAIGDPRGDRSRVRLTPPASSGSTTFRRPRRGSCDRSKPDRVPWARRGLAASGSSATAGDRTARALIGTEVSLLAHRPRAPT